MTDTPTTRADHAELARRLRVKAHIENLKCRPGHHVQFGTPSVEQVPNYWNRDLAADLEALLSEIAALRGSLIKANSGFEEYERKFYLEQDDREQVERQRDELRKALETIDGVLSDEIKARFGTSSSTSEAELGKGSVIYSLLIVPRDAARQALANQGANQ